MRGAGAPGERPGRPAPEQGRDGDPPRPRAERRLRRRKGRAVAHAEPGRRPGPAPRETGAPRLPPAPAPPDAPHPGIEEEAQRGQAPSFRQEAAARQRRMTGVTMPTSPPEKPFGTADPDLSRWAERTFAPEDRVLAEIRERSVAAGLPAIGVGKMDGLHLEVLARICGARKAVEIGTLGGYSGVCILRGMNDSN